jgi:hypothetical protein
MPVPEPVMRLRSNVTAPGAVITPVSWLKLALSARTMNSSLDVSCTPPVSCRSFWLGPACASRPVTT